MERYTKENCSITPAMISTVEPNIDSHFHGAFSFSFKYERAAFVIIWMYQVLKREFDEAFALEEFIDFCDEQQGARRDDARAIPLLKDQGYLIETEEGFALTTTFVEACYDIAQAA